MTEDLFRQMALDLEDINSDREEMALLVSRKACSMSVKAGKRLSLPEMERLLIDLDSAESGYSCPHGRPTRISFDEVEIEKLFGRR
jgi:DNA mismatch repair protein MutL